MNTHSLKVTIRVIISCVLLYLFLEIVPVATIVETLKNFSPSILALSILIHVISTLVSAMRWKLLLPEYSLLQLFKTTYVGQFYVLVLPGQITGELTKAYRLSKSISPSKGGRITISIVLDKVIGLLGVLTVAFFGILLTKEQVLIDFFPHPLLVLISGVVILAGIWCLFFTNYTFQGIKKIVSKILVKLHFLQFVQDSLQALREYSKKPWTVLWSFIIGVLFQVLSVIIIYLFAQDLGISSIHFVEYLWIFGIVTLAVALPITVAGIGVREGVFVFFLSHQFGVSTELALTLSLSTFSLQVLAAIVGGVLEFYTVFSKRKNIKHE